MAEYNANEFFAAERYARSICMTCANEMNCDGKNEFGVVVECSKYAGEYSKPKTNGDRIRAMSDEELAAYLTERFLLVLPDNIRTDVDVAKECYSSALDWLKQEVEHGKSN